MLVSGVANNEPEGIPSIAIVTIHKRMSTATAAGWRATQYHHFEFTELVVDCSDTLGSFFTECYYDFGISRFKSYYDWFHRNICMGRRAL